MITIAGYVRVSKEEQAEKDLSIPAQKARIIAYCQSQGWELRDIYVDDGYSAKNLNRPEMKRLLNDCKQNMFNAVVVVRLDRISRSQKDVLYLIEDVFEPNEIGFKSVTQAFDTTTAFGKAAIGMIAVFAQLERDQLIERVSEAKKEAARQGRFMGGQPPFGYAHNPAKKIVEINEIEAQVIHMIYNIYLRGETGYQAIADKLNEQKISPRRTKSWSRSTVRKLLTNPFYAGYIAHKEQFYKGQHDAIVTVEQYNEVQELLKTRNKYLPQIHSGLISGCIYCGECGARMRTKNVWQNHPQTDPKKITRYYICYSQDGSTPYMIKNASCRCGYKKANNIDQLVINRLMKYATKPRLVKEVAAELLAKVNTASTALASVQTKKELEAIKKKLNRWYDAFEKGALDPEQLTERVKDLSEQRYHLEHRLLEYEAAETTVQAQARSIEDFIETLKSFKKVWREATPEEQKAVVRSLIKRVTVYEDNHIDIEFFSK
ncbi:MAG: recombinase family protein [Veillonellales bacterium]